jgi:peptide/nickel transport system permease protein/oligopeptide transport system permease protein
MKYIIRKIASLVITLLIISFVTFLAFNVIPGDAAASKLGMDATEEQVEALREAMGLNDPFIVQYGR